MPIAIPRDGDDDGVGDVAAMMEANNKAPHGFLGVVPVDCDSDSAHQASHRGAQPGRLFSTVTHFS